MKIRLFSVLATAVLLSGGCFVEEIPTGGGTITAVMEDDQTRTSVTDEGSFTWSAGDQAWLGTTNGGIVGTLASGEGTSNAQFAFGTFFGEMTGKAVYPYNSDHSISGDELGFVLPASYELGSSLSNTNAAMYGEKRDATIKFNHLAGVMRFRFNDVPVGTNKFQLTLDKKINGTFSADLTADYPVLQTEATDIAAEKTVTLNFDALTTVSDISLYVPLPLGTYTTLDLNLWAGDQSVWTYSNTVSNTINRKSLILMPTVNMGGTVDGEIDEDYSSESDGPVDMNLSEAGYANSYMVSAAGTYRFVPSRGSSLTPVKNISSVEVLWESFGTDVTPSVGDLIRNLKYKDDIISFETPELFKEGNAVIAAKDASGNILWSWHIWFTDKPEEQEYYKNAGTMMDRNLGATSATPGDVGALGLLYQWGRKDPFVGASAIAENVVAKSTITWPSAVESTASTGTIEYTILNPTTFLLEADYNYDWYYTGSQNTDNTRWTTSGSSKSVYDPCPSGWRVPDGGRNSVWSKAYGLYFDLLEGQAYDSVNKGMDFSNVFGSSSVIWYPASGVYIDLGACYLSYVGSSTFYWTASPLGGNACSLYIDDRGWAQQQWGCLRAMGAQVRCIKDESSVVTGEFKKSSYTLTLSTASSYGWKKSTNVSNPDASLYDGVYESTNQGVGSSCSMMYIDISDYDSFRFYVRSDAESTYDFVVVSNLDATLTSSTTSGSAVKMTTSGKQSSGTSINGYTLVEFTGIGGGDHRITVMYTKDSTVNKGADKGYLLIPNNQ